MSTDKRGGARTHMGNYSSTIAAPAGYGAHMSSIGTAFGAARGVGRGIYALNSANTSARALSTLNSGCNRGAMNIPDKPLMHESIFYLPRNSEMTFENKLFENRTLYHNKVMRKKYKLK